MKHDPNTLFPDEAAEREWLAQERALADERADRVMVEPLRAYRLIARVASAPPSWQLPADFAQRTAQRAGSARRVDDSRFERNLLWALGALLGLGGGAALVWFAPVWLPVIGSTAAVLDRPGPWALAVCLGLSALASRWFGGTHHG